MAKTKLIPIIVATIFIAALGGYVAWQKMANVTPSQPTVNGTANWQTYRNATYSFEFQYPSTYSFDAGGGHNFLEEQVIDMISDAKYPGTNFSGSSLEVSIGTDTTKCLTGIRGGSTSLTEKRTVNGVIFYKGSFTGAAAGTAYVSDIYRTVRANSLCLEVAFMYGIYNRQNLENPDSVREFDPKSELATYDQILSTFKFISPSGSKACTMEAKLCPDGSYVSRTGPNCEFAACLGVSAKGILNGTVSIGPICPVETNPPQPGCMPTPETYAAREFLVLSSDQTKTITSFHANADGKYNVALAPGTYVVVSAKTGFGYVSNLPQTVMIKANQTTTLDISVDTGIR